MERSLLITKELIGKRKRFNAEQREAVYKYFVECGSVKKTMREFNISDVTVYKYFYEFEKGGKKAADYTVRKSRKRNA
jgi:transposase